MNYHRWWPRWLRRWWLKRTLREAEKARADLESDEMWAVFRDQPPFKQLMEMETLGVRRLKAELLSLSPLKKGDEVLATKEFTCPFCGGKCFLVEDPPSVAHVEPPCVTFVRTRPEQFLYAVNHMKQREN